MKILAAEIKPAPKVIIDNNELFTEQQIVECKHMIALARPYALGSEETIFELQFGVIISNEINTNIEQENIEKLLPYKSYTIILSNDELAKWGENDEVCFNLIAKKLNINILSFREIQMM